MARSGYAAIRAGIDERQREVEAALQGAVETSRLTLVKAPPGSGKTHTLLKTAAHGQAKQLRIAVGTQTNRQADDICSRIARDHPAVPAVRFIAGKGERPGLGGGIRIEETTAHLPHGSCVVVATAAKWGMVDLGHPFDVLLIDEAWQMSWANMMLLGQVAARFILIGDPGQIPPVVAIDTSRWETAEKPPHIPAPEVILRDPELRETTTFLELPRFSATPYDTVELIQPFYDFPFRSWAGPGERAIQAGRGGSDHIDRAIDLLSTGTMAAATLPTPDGGPPLEKDDPLARLAAEIVTRLLDRKATYRDDGETVLVQPEQIGITATHRVMNTAIHLALPASVRGEVVVDTPERWQGLERQVMIAMHPLSGVERPSEFDLETGRLCVMASRHRGGLVLLGRDHIAETLERTVPSAAQPVGKPDVAGRGHAVHSGLWERLRKEERLERIS